MPCGGVDAGDRNDALWWSFGLQDMPCGDLFSEDGRDALWRRGVGTEDSSDAF